MNMLPASPIGFEELVAFSGRLDAEVSEIHTSTADLAFEPEAIVVAGQRLPINEEHRARIFSSVKAPAKYLAKHDAELQAAVLNAHLRRNDFGDRPTVVVRDGMVDTVARGELHALQNSAVMGAIGDVLGDDASALFTARIANENGTLDIELVAPSQAIAVRPGDVVKAGLHISHSRFGGPATLIESFIYRLVCTNGLTRRECRGEGAERTRRLSVELPDGRERQLEQIRKITSRTWDGLQDQLEALKATNDRQADVERLLVRWLREARMYSGALLRLLLAAWEEEGSESTWYGAINAVSRVATHHRELSARQRRLLASLAGVLAFEHVHFCRHCLSVLSDGERVDEVSPQT